jgi:hypothetical protein
MNGVAAGHVAMRDGEDAFETYAQLRRQLGRQYAEPADWHRVVEDCGLDPATLELVGRAINVWSKILGTLRRRKRLDRLVVLVRSEYPEVEELARQHAEDVASGAYAAPDPEQSEAVAAPVFVAADNFLGAYRRHAFGGRDREIEALNAWLAGDYDELSADTLGGAARSSRLLITAPAGRGKSALLVRWMDQLNKAWSLVFVPISIRYRSNEELTFYQALATDLARILGEVIGGSPIDPTAYYRTKCREYLGRLATGARRCVVVIDGLDEARGWEIGRDLLPASSSPSLKVVASAREQAGDRGPAQWLNRLDWDDACTLELRPLSLEGVKDVLEKLDFPIGPLSQDIDIVAELYRLTERGDPFLLQLYVKDLVSLRKKGVRLTPRDLQARPAGFGAYFKEWLKDQRTEWEESGEEVDNDLQEHILAILASAFGPLKLADLAELVGRTYRSDDVFTSESIEPLRRFIIGDGFDTGYVLTHPKLAIFLEREHFGAANKILRDIKAAFIAWMSEAVQRVNAGDIAPADVPEYALLFYTQHLATVPSERALGLYRDLIEDGWRKAWESHSAGFQGFFRDVELAQQAFQAAVDRDPAQLRKPRTGLGALVRCALCLSSGRSIGLGIPSALLAEFLRTGSITPQQAVHLVEMKEDRARAEAVQAIFELLPRELRPKAQACLRDVRDPDSRFSGFMTVLHHLDPHEWTSTATEALRTVEQLRDHRTRQAGLERLKPYLPPAIMAAAELAERERAEAERREQEEEERHKREAEQSSRKAESNAEASLERAQSELMNWDAHHALVQEAQRDDLTVERMKDLLERGRSADSYTCSRIVEQLGPRLPEELLDLALDCIWQLDSDWQRADSLIFSGTALAPLSRACNPARRRRRLSNGVRHRRSRLPGPGASCVAPVLEARAGPGSDGRARDACRGFESRQGSGLACPEDRHALGHHEVLACRL